VQKLKRLSDKEYKFVYSRAPRLCVDVLVFTEKGFLLSKREIPPFKGLWHLPGGRVFYRESIENAIKRIALEEVGVRVKMLKMLGYYEMLKDGPYVHSGALIFTVKIMSGSVRGSAQAREIKAFRNIPIGMNPPQKFFLGKNWNKIKRLLLETGRKEKK
jgi:ADP-ribose pyrophosphatase YjhB (NUDIX family)